LTLQSANNKISKAIMVNLFSIRCSLAFGPYIAESTAGFLTDGAMPSRVVRQGGSGLIMRAGEDVVLRHQNREAFFAREDARHYLATVRFRCEFHDVLRMPDEVVMANVGRELLLSHPQSDLWLKEQHVAELVLAFRSNKGNIESSASLPDWLIASTGAGRLMLSDQRNGRWVLLGEDHVNELERRLFSLRLSPESVAQPTAPAISLKGLSVHLQSAFKLAKTLETFAETGSFATFEEIAPGFSLRAKSSIEGIEIADSDRRVALTSKEARKWASIFRAELARLNASCFERGRIRTVFADADQGRWILQWGDEVLVRDTLLSQIKAAQNGQPVLQTQSLALKRTPEFLLLLLPASGECVALDESERERLLEGI
jgi:hypothetical protein